jgi:molybdate transport system ATP-binding protein
MSSGSGLYARLEARVGSLVIDVELWTSGATLVLAGPNGAGKSTLLSLVLGALRPERGVVSVGQTVLLDTARGIDVPIEDRRLGYVPQNYSLFPHLDVRGNVAFGPQSCGAPNIDARVDAVLERLSIAALARRDVRRLSGGERQRVALARALALEPRALLLDEPLAALAPDARDEVREALAETLERLALPTLLVTHDAADARRLGQSVSVLEAGKITHVGAFEELERQPASRFLEQFLSG